MLNYTDITQNIIFVKDKYNIFSPLPGSISRKYELQSSFTFSRMRLSNNRMVLKQVVDLLHTEEKEVEE